jgi:hypothetical protein
LRALVRRAFLDAIASQLEVQHKADHSMQFDFEQTTLHANILF